MTPLLFLLLVQFSKQALDLKLSSRILSSLQVSLDVIELFEFFIHIYGKKYTISSEEGKTRLNFFKESLQFIKTHNSTQTEYAITEFSDLSSEEFTSLMSNNKIQSAISKHSLLKATPPQSICDNCIYIDWKVKMNHPRNQLQCGSCWAFSTLSAIEGAYAIRSKRIPYLSVQELVDCSKNGNEGCNGGFPHLALDYIKLNGVASEMSYPYLGSQSRCNPGPHTKTFISKYSSCSNIYEINKEAVKPCTLHKWLSLLSEGPIIVVMDVSSKHFQFYSGGVIKLTEDDCKNVNHAVVVVGYAHNILTVQNSWGDKWGEGGYFKVELNEEASQTCFLTASAFLPKILNS